MIIVLCILRFCCLLCEGRIEGRTVQFMNLFRERDVIYSKIYTDTPKIRMQDYYRSIGIKYEYDMGTHQFWSILASQKLVMFLVVNLIKNDFQLIRRLWNYLQACFGASNFWFIFRRTSSSITYNQVKHNKQFCFVFK